MPGAGGLFAEGARFRDTAQREPLQSQSTPDSDAPSGCAKPAIQRQLRLRGSIGSKSWDFHQINRRAKIP
jgi:hypothetical protein